jgi:predicted ATPase
MEKGLRVVRSSGYRMVESDLYRSQGDLLLAGGRKAEAEASFRQAIESARRIEAKSWELRAVLSLSRLWQRQGKLEAARDLLTPIYGWFSEGLDTPDLQEAAALLDELAWRDGDLPGAG